MKLAIVHDDLVRRGGAEQVASYFHLAFPEAPIYTLAYRPYATYEIFRECEVRTSFLQPVILNEKIMKATFFPFGIIAMKNMDLTAFDVILISSTFCGKYIKVSPHALVINYCHTPFRLAWDPESYHQYEQSEGLKKILFKRIIKSLKKIDYQAAQRTDFYLTNSHEVRSRIRKFYNYPKEIFVINPPVDCDKFYISKEIKDYFLVVSRLEYYKRIDLVIDLFNKLNFPLIIVGKGTMLSDLKSRAKKNIIFKSNLSTEELATLFSECKALIFPQYEDYGITPLEANASGRPVIAYAKGGVLETMIPYSENNADKSTAVFFPEQTEESLETALNIFNSVSFNSTFIKNHSKKFHKNLFISKIKNFVQEKFHEIHKPVRAKNIKNTI
ncbi:glycosyltransferase family 4 protein [soil metagenome]